MLDDVQYPFKIQIPCQDSKVKVDHDVTLGLAKFDVFPPLSILAYCSQRSMHMVLVLLLTFAYDKLVQESVICVSASVQRTRVSHASTRLSLSASISSMTATVHGPPIQAPSQVARGADVKLDFVLKAIRKEVKVDEENLPMGMQILERLDHLKSQHRRSMFDSTNVCAHVPIPTFILSLTFSFVGRFYE